MQSISKQTLDKYYAVGIVSYGFQCGREGFPGVYAKVEYYLDFIESILNTHVWF